LSPYCKEKLRGVIFGAIARVVMSTNNSDPAQSNSILSRLKAYPNDAEDKAAQARVTAVIAASRAAAAAARGSKVLASDLKPLARQQAFDDCRVALLTLAKYARGYSAEDVAHGLASARTPHLPDLREAIAFVARLREALNGAAPILPV
jgi:hypothetical protein